MPIPRSGIARWRFHGNIVFGELVAGLGVVGVAVQRLDSNLNAESLQVGLNQLCITDMCSLAAIDGQSEADSIAVLIHIHTLIILGISASVMILGPWAGSFPELRHPCSRQWWKAQSRGWASVHRALK